jgi:cellobiose phosphorylase
LGHEEKFMSSCRLHAEFVADVGFGLSTVSRNGMSLSVLPNGSVYAIEAEGILINQVLASPVAGGIGRLTLRILERDRVRLIPIFGPGSPGGFRHHDDRFVWSGHTDELDYIATTWLASDGRGWLTRLDVTNRSPTPLRIDAILIQDLALATRGQARSNELFTSQYLDHRLLEVNGTQTALVTRQNLAQTQGRHPWLFQTCTNGLAGVMTDGFDALGLPFRSGAVPACMRRRELGHAVRQYEAAYTTLQAQAIEIAPGKADAITFVARYEPHHPQASGDGDLAHHESARAMVAEFERSSTTHSGGIIAWTPGVFDRAEPICGRVPTESELRALFKGHWGHVESSGDRIDSFFLDDASHVATRAKLDAVARPHGQVYRAGSGIAPDDEVLSLAVYAHGQFGSQVTVGNSVLAKMTSPARDPLNAIRSSGLRIFMRDGDAWRQLATPSAFEMRLDGCRWTYLIDDDTVEVYLTLDPARPVARHALSSRRERVWLICAEVACGPAEYDQPARASFDAGDGTITLRPAKSALVAQKQPGIALELAVDEPGLIDRLGGDEVLFDRSSSRGLPYAVILSRPTSRLGLAVRGTFGSTPPHPEAGSDAESISHTVDLLGVTRFDHASSPHADLLNTTLAWLAHDARIHMSVTRGLEQYNGGAWGVRDVCQGPVEYLLAFDRADDVASILRRVFSHQYRRRGDWPQWFMLEPYQAIQSSHCHGDVLIWPIKALCDYLEQTDDRSILDEPLPYTDDTSFDVAEPSEPLIDHVDRAVRRMTEAFIEGTHLPRFGEGDWDDSLQPADATLRERMVSSWTTALMFQTLDRYSTALERFDESSRASRIRQLADAMREDFQKHLIIDDVVAGFVVFEPGTPKRREVLLHPLDRRTGLHHRLIPMTRSMLAGLFTPDQARHHLDLIRTHLLYPDGARLMDRPTRYSGGVETIFRRSESASFFGREIGLQYVHAHLRYAEALATLGEADALWHALRSINPVCVTDAVPNARPRQRNAYFSSSDAAFADRSDATQRYDELRDGRIAVDGGWRVYSSGPGIHANLILRHLLGLRWHYDRLVIDPVLPRELSTLACTLSLAGRTTRVRFDLANPSARRVTLNDRVVATDVLARSYRDGAVTVGRQTLMQRLDREVNDLVISGLA